MTAVLGPESQPLPSLESAPTHHPVNPIDPGIILDVSKKGDAIDAMRMPLRRFSAYPAVKTGALAAATTMQLFTDGPYPHVRFIGYGLGAAGMAEGQRRIREIRIKRATERRLGAQSGLSAYDEPIELFRHTRKGEKGRIDLYWGAQIDPEVDVESDVRDRLESMAMLAKTSGLDRDRMVIPASIASYLSEEEQGMFKPVPTSNWMKSIKKLGNRVPIDTTAPKKAGTKNNGVQNVLVLSPDECLELAAKLKHESLSDINILEYARDLLLKDQPRNGFLQRYANRFDELSNSGNIGKRQEASKTLRSIINASLFDVSVTRGPNHETVRIDTTGSVSSKRPSVRMTGSHSIEADDNEPTVLHTEESNTLLAQLGISTTDLALFYNHPGKLTKKMRIQIAQVVMLYELSGWQQPFVPDQAMRASKRIGVQSQDTEDIFHQGLQLSTALDAKMIRKKTLKKFDNSIYAGLPDIHTGRIKNRKWVRAYGALALTLLMATQGSKIISMPANMAREMTAPSAQESYLKEMTGNIAEACARAEQSYGYACDPKELLKEMKKGNIPPELEEDFEKYQHDPLNDALARANEIDSQMKEVLTRNNIGGDYMDSEEAKGLISDRRDAIGDNSDALERANQGEAGNIEYPENKPLWKINGNGQATTGFWIQSTYRDLITNQTATNGYVHWISKGVNELDDYDFAPRAIVTRHPDDAEKDTSLIHVSSVLPHYEDGTYRNDGQEYVSIPTLVGTKPAAIRVQTEDIDTGAREIIKARIVQLNDGTFTAVFEDTEYHDTPVVIDYWLEKTTEQTRLPYGSVKGRGPITINSFYYGNSAFNFELGSAKAEVDKHIPGLPSGGMLRTAALADTIREHFAYNGYPFTQIDGKNDRATTAPQYVERALGQEQASYGTASTILALDNPDHINVASGYLNRTSQDQLFDTLSSNENSQWGIDESGTIYNPTPKYSGVDGTIYSGTTEKFEKGDFELPRAPGANTVDVEGISGESSSDNSGGESSSKDSPLDSDNSPKAEQSGSEKAKENNDRIKHILEAAGVVAAAGVLLYNRRAIAESARRKRRAVRVTRAKLASRRLDHLLDKRTSEATTAIGIIEDTAYLPAGQPVVLRKELTPLTSKEIRERLHRNRHPEASSNKKIAIHRITAASQTNDQLREDKRTRRLAGRMIKLDRIQSMSSRSPKKVQTPSRKDRKSARSVEIAAIASSTLFQQPTGTNLTDQSAKQVVRSLKTNPVMQSHNRRTRRAVRRLVRIGVKTKA